MSFVSCMSAAYWWLYPTLYSPERKRNWIQVCMCVYTFSEMESICLMQIWIVVACESYAEEVASVGLVLVELHIYNLPKKCSL